MIGTVPELLLILEKFPVNLNGVTIRSFGDGLINTTYLVEAQAKKYILQKVNTKVFIEPEIIANNLRLANDYLKLNASDYLFINQLKSIDNKEYVVYEDEFWRLSHFLENTHSINIISKAEEAYEAAKAFGKLTRNLHGIAIDNFEPTIPNFHNLTFRYKQFKEAIDNAIPERKEIADELVENYLSQRQIVSTYEHLVLNPEMPVRIMHHDTKINNVLFDKTSIKAVAVCDLDTLMPGRIISDIGDIYRTYLSPVSEETTDYEQITIREDIYKAIRKGYLSELGSVLTVTEKQYLDFGGEFMIYMQGIRFLADYLIGDNYYPIKHSRHNLNRAKNQWILLRAFQKFTKS